MVYDNYAHEASVIFFKNQCLYHYFPSLKMDVPTADFPFLRKCLKWSLNSEIVCKVLRFLKINLYFIVKCLYYANCSFHCYVLKSNIICPCVVLIMVTSENLTLSWLYLVKIYAMYFWLFVMNISLSLWNELWDDDQR